MNPVFAIELVCLVAAALLAASLFAQWRTSAACDRKVRIRLLLLRGASVLALVALALNLGVWKPVTRANERDWVVLVDRSASMGTADVDGKPRIGAAMAMARQAKAEGLDAARLRVVPFDTQVRDAVEDVAAGTIDAGGAGTDLNRALHELLDRYQGGGRELAGVAVLSDGRQTAERPAWDSARRAVARAIGVTVVPLGGEVPRRDLQVSPVRRQLVAHKGQRLKVRARATNRNLGDLRTAVKLVGPGGSVVDETTVSLTNNASAEVVLHAVPTNSGQVEYRVEAPVWPGEALVRNNADRVLVSVLEQPIRVLLVEGTPYWDSKFLAQLLRLQTNIAITAIYRVSAERSLRIDSGGTKPGGRVDEAFPADAATLSGYDLLVFGKGVEYFLDAPRVALVKSFLREQGGSVIFSRGRPYHGSSFPEMEAIEPVEWGQALGAEFRWQPTGEGEAAGLFEGLLPGRADPVWSRLPAMRSANGCKRVKTFASVLVEGRTATAGGPESGFPVVVAMRHGRGLVVAINGEGLWQWDFFSSSESKELYEDFWLQLMQWSVTYSDFLPGYSYALRVGGRMAFPGDTVRVRVAHRGGGQRAERMEVAVSGPSGKQVLVPAAVEGQEDRWETAFPVDRHGIYSVSVSDGATGALLAPAEEVEVPAPPGELDECSVDEAYLSRFAKEAGGRVLPAASWKQWIAEMKPQAPVDAQAESVWESRWDRAWVLLLVAGFLGAEWYLRRRNGLA